MKKVIITICTLFCVNMATEAQTLNSQKANAAGQQGTIKDSTNLGQNYGNTTDAPAGTKSGKKTKKSTTKKSANTGANNAANNSPNNSDAR